MVFDYHRFHFWTCKVLGLPVSLDTKTRVYIKSRWSPIPTLILLVICTISSLFFSRANVGDHHLNELIFNSDFHRFVGWFQINYDCSIAIVLLLLMLIQRKELVTILNTRTRMYRLLSATYPDIRMSSHRQLYSKQVLILWSFLIVKTVDFYAEMSDVVDGPLNIPSIAMLCQLKFPMLVFTLVNNLFLDNVAFLIIFLKKLHQVVREGTIRVSVKAHQRCQLSDLIDEMAQVYAAIHQHKNTMTRMVSCAMVLLFAQRFFDMVTRMFYIYSSVISYRLSNTFNYTLTTCHVVDLLVTIAELSLICNSSERILEEVSY